MGKRYTVTYPRNFRTRDGKDQVEWMEIGSAFESRNGDGFDAYLHVMPPFTTMQDGSIAARLIVREAMSKEEREKRRQGGQRGPQNGQRAQGGQGGGHDRSGGYDPDLPPPSDDDIPF